MNTKATTQRITPARLIAALLVLQAVEIAMLSGYSYLVCTDNRNWRIEISGLGFLVEGDPSLTPQDRRLIQIAKSHAGVADKSVLAGYKIRKIDGGFNIFIAYFITRSRHDGGLEITPFYSSIDVSDDLETVKVHLTA
ncbi:MAG: hypothetical protein K8S99_01645 [Planctomycetes bacterium]|nr:hypothetical protein [Planctomycetota bacterium]